jgi:hypothetical protein
MSCIILHKTEHVVQVYEWVDCTPEEIKENEENNLRLSDTMDKTGNALRTVEGTQQRQILSERGSTQFGYDIPEVMRTSYLLDLLNSLSQITDMIEVFIKNDYNLHSSTTTSIGNTIYSSFILLKSKK